MNLLHLYYFYSVAKEGGYTKASKALHVQQPAISRMVKLLEDDFGLELFERVGRKVQLTHAGAAVFEHCKEIFGAVEGLKRSIGEIGGAVKGPLSIGASEPIAGHFLPKILKTFLRQHPEAYPSVFSAPASLLFEKLASGQIEFALLFHTPELTPQLEIFDAKEFPFNLVIRRDLRRNRETIESFIGSREIDDVATKRFPTLERIRRQFKGATIKISSNNLSAHLEMVKLGMGVSILPNFLVAEDLRRKTVVDVFPDESFRFQMKIVKRKHSVLSNGAKALINECLKQTES